MLKWPDIKNEVETEYDYFARIHYWALSIFIYTPDQVVWGIPELWPTKTELEELANQNHGMVTEDCDGFAQLCRYALAMSGYDSRLVICNTEVEPTKFGNHCVAELKDGWVFDNRQPLLSSWQTLLAKGYQKVKMGPLCNPNEPYLKGEWHEAL